MRQCVYMLKTGFLCLHGAVGQQELWTAEGEGKCISVTLGEYVAAGD